jgi:hypothetical protein
MNSENANSISSRNALKHGCCALDTMLLPNESAEDFKALESTWLKAYSPANDAERHLVSELIHADWLLQRTTRTYAQIEAKLYADSPNPLDWTDQQQRTLGRFLRYRTAHLNTVNKCRKAIDDYRKSRLSESIAAEKIKNYQNKNRPEPTWKEHLESMRQRAISLGYTPPDPSKL